MFAGVGFDLGETLIEYEGVPLDWQSEYPPALAAVAATSRGLDWMQLAEIRLQRPPGDLSASIVVERRMTRVPL